MDLKARRHYYPGSRGRGAFKRFRELSQLRSIMLAGGSQPYASRVAGPADFDREYTSVVDHTNALDAFNVGMAGMVYVMCELCEQV